MNAKYYPRQDIADYSMLLTEGQPIFKDFTVLSIASATVAGDSRFFFSVKPGCLMSILVDLIYFFLKEL